MLEVLFLSWTLIINSHTYTNESKALVTIFSVLLLTSNYKFSGNFSSDSHLQLWPLQSHCPDKQSSTEHRLTMDIGEQTCPHRHASMTQLSLWWVGLEDTRGMMTYIHNGCPWSTCSRLHCLWRNVLVCCIEESQHSSRGGCLSHLPPSMLYAPSCLSESPRELQKAWILRVHL